jgi:hypothetical protein
MNRSAWLNILLAITVVILFALLLNNGQPVVAQLQQATVVPQSGDDDGGGSLTSSQGTEVKSLPVSGEALDEQGLSPNSVSVFYHIPGSVLMPVDSTTTLGYDGKGCVHAKTGGSDLLNAPLDIPDGSTLIGARLYYYDGDASKDLQGWITRYNLDGTTFDDIVSIHSSGSGGRGNTWGAAISSMSVIDMYNWSYVLNARLNGASNTLQVCGLRVMYDPPSGCCTYLPSILRSTSP